MNLSRLARSFALSGLLFGALSLSGAQFCPPQDPGTLNPELLKAIRHLDAERASILLQAGVSPHGLSPEGRSSLLETLLSESIDRRPLPVLIALLAAGADPNSRGTGSTTPLIQAATAGDVSSVKTLLSFGANVELEDSLNTTTPLLASVYRGTATFLLFEAGVDVNHSPSGSTTTPLFAAVVLHHFDIAEEMLVRGANINCHSRWNGATPLIFAVSQDDLRSVQFLLDHGADIYSADKTGVNALHRARASGNAVLRRVLEQYIQ